MTIFVFCKKLGIRLLVVPHQDTRNTRNIRNLTSNLAMCIPGQAEGRFVHVSPMGVSSGAYVLVPHSATAQMGSHWLVFAGGLSRRLT